jgi:hypothetical protein
MDPELRVRLEPHTGQPISSATPVRGGGYTPAGRWRLHLADGSTLFAKVGSSPLTAGWVRDEALWYSQLSGDFLPALRGFVDHPEHPVLLLEDLSHARWPPPWEPGDLQRLQGLLARLASADPLPSDERPSRAGPRWRETPLPCSRWGCAPPRGYRTRSLRCCRPSPT